MMLYPSMTHLLEKINSRYLMVNVIARRAREIANIAEESEESLSQKPVSQAIVEIAEDKLEIRVNR